MDAVRKQYAHARQAHAMHGEVRKEMHHRFPYEPLDGDDEVSVRLEKKAGSNSIISQAPNVSDAGCSKRSN